MVVVGLVATSSSQRRRGLRKSGCRKLQFSHGQPQIISDRIPTDSRKFPTEEIIGAQNFNFALKFPQNGD